LPILPLIDLMILSGTGLLAVGFVLKVVAIATVYNPTVLGFSSMDFLTLAGVCWGLALVLAARAWVRLNEPNLVALRRAQLHQNAVRQAQEFEYTNGHRAEVAPAPVEAAGTKVGAADGR